MRCRKARWYLSALCDDTLSEKQRRELKSHLEECPACRREAFYFSEIKGQTGHLEQIRARADFDLRLRTRIKAYEAEERRPKPERITIWGRVASAIAEVRLAIVNTGHYLASPKRYALVGISTAALAILLWTGYTGDEQTTPTAETTITATPAQQAYVEPIHCNDLNADYVVATVSLSDETSARVPPNYMMPTVPAEVINASVAF